MNKEIEIPEGYEARIEGNKVIIGPKESEDERIRKELIEGLKLMRDRGSFVFIPSDIDKAITYLEKQKEQKPAEWSEEDKVMLNNIIWSVHMKSIIKPLYEMDDRSRYKKYEDFLKALPERFNLQPKQEWSEEDESFLDSIEEAIHSYYDLNHAPQYDYWLEEKLKSLRPLPHWKPSEEQMEALSDAYAEARTFKMGDILESLYEDLEKL